MAPMSSPALQLGVSHQTPDTLTPARMNFLRQMGVEKIEVRIPKQRQRLRRHLPGP